MTAALYSLTAVLAASMATRAWLLDRDDRARRAFLGLGWTLAIAYLAFALAFLPHLDALRALWTGAGCLAPAFGWRTIDALFPPKRESRWEERLLPIGVGVGVCTSVAHAVLYAGAPRSSPPEIVAGVFAFFVLGVIVHRIGEAADVVELSAVETRLTWLRRLLLLATILSFAEWIVRTTQPIPDPSKLAFFDRGLALQGPLPPLSTVVVAAAVYMLHSVLQAQRLVALQEMLARLVVVLGAAAVLVVAWGVTVWWVALARFPLHSSYLLWLVSGVALSTFEAVRVPLQRRAGRWLHPTAHHLDDAARLLQRDLHRHIEINRVATDLIDRLFGSGRFDGVGAWVLDPERGGYRALARLGLPQSPADVGGAPCPQSLRDGAAIVEPPSPLCVRLGAHLLLPFRDDADPDVVHGWLAVRDATWSDGFSDDERSRLRAVADAATHALANLASLRRLAEERRLAALGTMSAGLAHEIRNPLAGLKGAAQILEDEPLSGEAREMVDIVLRETDRLDRVVSSFLTFARPVHLERVPTDVADVVDHAVRLLRAEGLPQGVTLHVHADDVAPVLGDEARLGQVVINLLRNARDAVAGQGRIDVAITQDDDAVCVEVRDDGPGITPEVLAQLRTPFFTTKPAGTGLGLAISDRIVEAHGGRLGARSVPGEGATFTIRLPAAPSPDAYSADTLASRAAAGSVPAPGTKRLSS